MVGKKNAEDALNALDDSEFSGTHIQVQVRWFIFPFFISHQIILWTIGQETGAKNRKVDLERR